MGLARIRELEQALSVEKAINKEMERELSIWAKLDVEKHVRIHAKDLFNA